MEVNRFKRIGSTALPKTAQPVSSKELIQLFSRLVVHYAYGLENNTISSKCRLDRKSADATINPSLQYRKSFYVKMLVFFNDCYSTIKSC